MLKRTNQEWLTELCGDEGYQAQALAHDDLAGYLYTVAYNYLLTRQAKANPQILVGFAPMDLAALAQDFVQETLEKLAKNDFALLNQFKGEGNFTGWVAIIVRRQVAQELRKSYWERRQSLSENGATEEEEQEEFELVSDEISPEKAVMQQEVSQALLACLGQLKPDQRAALVGLIVEGKSGKALAEALNRPNENAIYKFVGRTKRKVRKCLQKAGWEQDVLEIFVKSNE